MDRSTQTRSPRGGDSQHSQPGWAAHTGRPGSPFAAKKEGRGHFELRSTLNAQRSTLNAQRSTLNSQLSHSKEAHSLIFPLELMLAEIIKIDFRAREAA